MKGGFLITKTTPRGLQKQLRLMHVYGLSSMAFDWRDIAINRFNRGRFIKTFRKEFIVDRCPRGFIVYF